MKRTIFSYGIVSGLIVAFFMVISMVFLGDKAFDYGMIFGFGSMILAFSVIYFAIQKYKVTRKNGYISFKDGLLIGLGISVMCTAFYVVTWLIIFYNFIPDFFDRYAAHYMESLRRSGASESEIQQKMTEMNAMSAKYNSSTFYVIWNTFLEIFPLGLFITLISAGIHAYNSKKAKVSA